MSEVAVYQKRYKKREKLPYEDKAKAWMKINRPDLYARWMKQDVLDRIEEQTPTFQEYWRNLEEEVDREIRVSDDYKFLALDQIEGRITKRDVKNAYRRAARRLHPDAGGSDEAFKELHAAYRRVLAVAPKE